MAEFLRGWGLVSTHGDGARACAEALRAGTVRPEERSQAQWPVVPNGRSLAFYAAAPEEVSVVEALAARLARAWDEALRDLTPAERAELFENGALLFASTKGCVEDYIWKSAEGDPYTPVVEAFTRRTGFRPKRWLTVSNACASTHAALHLARGWLTRGEARWVAVLAADAVGPFVLQGFHALRALSPTSIRPFAASRDGLLLGEAAGVALLGPDGPLRLSASAIDCEGFAVTRPSGEARSLARALQAAAAHGEPDAVIAHGTATQANDAAEDAAFTSALPRRPWVTGTKASLGHCLVASGMVDLVAAAEWLRSGKPFALAHAEAPDPSFRSRLLTQRELADLAPRAWRRLLVSALGFGGVHAAFTLEKP
jgi:hypothetical protein